MNTECLQELFCLQEDRSGPPSRQTYLCGGRYITAYVKSDVTADGCYDRGLLVISPFDGDLVDKFLGVVTGVTEFNGTFCSVTG